MSSLRFFLKSAVAVSILCLTSVAFAEHKPGHEPPGQQPGHGNPDHGNDGSPGNGGGGNPGPNGSTGVSFDLHLGGEPAPVSIDVEHQTQLTDRNGHLVPRVFTKVKIAPEPPVSPS